MMVVMARQVEEITSGTNISIELFNATAEALQECCCLLEGVIVALIASSDKPTHAN